MRAARQSARYWIPLLAAAVCLVASMYAGAVLTYVLVMAAFGLLLDGTTAMWERNGSVGNLTDHRQ